MRVIEESHEFTWDMVRALPHINYFLNKGEDVEVRCKKNLESLYLEFTSNVVSNNKFSDAKNDKSTYNHHRPSFTTNRWLPPNLKEKWSGVLKFDKPTIVVQNKYTLEWCSGPYNYFSIDFLDKFFNMFKSQYQIIYIRPFENRKDYFTDGNKMLSFKDHDLIKEKHSDIITIDDIMKSNSELNFNTAQFAIHSTSERHISPSGGNAALAAYFGGDLLILDSYLPESMGELRGIWKTGSWLQYLGSSNIYGFDKREDLLYKAKQLWSDSCIC